MKKNHHEKMSSSSSSSSSSLVKWLITGGVATTVAVGGYFYFSSKSQQPGQPEGGATDASATGAPSATFPDLLLQHTSEVDRRFLAHDAYISKLCVRSVPYAELDMEAWVGLIGALSVLAKEMYKVHNTPVADVRPSFVSDVEAPVNAMNRALITLRNRLASSVRSSGSQSSHVRRQSIMFGYLMDDAIHYGNACVNNTMRKVQLRVLDV